MLKYKYKYNGKELQDELGLNMYDYGFRNYDPAIGRWMNIDPLAEKYYSTSMYTYVDDNPISSFDPNGLLIINIYKTARSATKGNMEAAESALNSIDKSTDKENWKTANKYYKTAKRAFNSIDKKFNATEKFISDLESIDSEWFNKLNNLTDLEGNSIDVTIGLLGGNSTFTSKSGDENDLLGNTDLLPADYKTESPSKTGFENNNGKKNVIGIQIKSNSPKSKFWHEIGHVFWLTSPNQNDNSYSNAYYYYTIYLKNNPQFLGSGGHGSGNIQNKPTDDAEDRYKKLKK